jgi:hypothetical protein
MHGHTNPKVTTRTVTLVVTLAALMLTGIGAAGTASAARPPAQAAAPTTIPVSGTLANGKGLVNGTLHVTRFVPRLTGLVGVGRFTGTVTNAAGKVLKRGSRRLALPVNLAASRGSCQRLNLALLAPVLGLLGQPVHLNPAHLHVNAAQAPGNILGSLLCTVAGLLNGPNSPLAGLLAPVLNQILGALG